MMKPTIVNVIGMGETVVEEIRIIIRMTLHMHIAQNAYALIRIMRGTPIMKLATVPVGQIGKEMDIVMMKTTTVNVIGMVEIVVDQM